jgi:SIR2-like domain
LRKEDRNEERSEIAKVLKFRKEAASAALRVTLNIENIEDLFSLAAASKKYPLEQTVSTAIAATIDFSRRNFKPECFEANVKHNFKRPENWQQKTSGQLEGIYRIPVYDAYAGLLSGKACGADPYAKNTIITFNYDTVLEDALENWQVPIWYGFESVEYDDSSKHARTKTDDSITVLKLHGSINWAQPNQPNQANGLMRVFGSYSDILATNRNVVLVPPTWRKTFTGAFSEMWDEALNALNEATRIIIIGFSLPPTDIHIKFLLAAGLQENISLRNIYCFNPNTEVEKNLFEILRPELKTQRIAEFRPLKLQDLLLGVTDKYQRVSMMFNRSVSDHLTNMRLADRE